MAADISRQLDYIPGDPAGIKRVARKFEQTAADITKAVDALKAAVINASKQDAKSVAAAEENASSVASKLSDLKGRYSEAGEALTTFSSELESAQTKAKNLVKEREEAQGTVSSLQSQRNTHQYNQPHPASETFSEDMTAHYKKSRALDDSIQQGFAKLRNLQERYETVVDDLKRAGRAASDKINGAIKADGFNDGTWTKFKNWVSKHAEALKILHTILATVTVLLTIASFFFPPLGLAALVAAGLTALTSFALASAGEMSWVDFGLDLLAVATFGVTRILTGMVKGVTMSLKSARITSYLGQGRSFAQANLWVNRSFDMVVMNSRPVNLFAKGNLTESAKWAWNVFSKKGIDNANFLRIVDKAKAGASSLDDGFIAAGNIYNSLIRGANTTKLVANMPNYTFDYAIPAAETVVNATLGGASKVPVVGEWLQDVGADSVDFSSATDWYQNLKDERFTWSIGS